MNIDTKERIHEKYLAGSKAQQAWARIPIRERVLALEKFSVLLQENCDRLAQLLTEEMGKPITQSVGEIRACEERIAYFCQQAPELLKIDSRGEAFGTKEFVTHEPLGVVANISAWNYPYFVGVNVFVPALLAGNAVLYKASEFTAQTGLEIEKLMHEAGVPKGIFQCIDGDGQVGQLLLEEDVDGVFFTGSYATGKKIAEQVAPKLIKLQLELGGKDPLYITEDVNVKHAAEEAASGAFFNNGQSCCAVERLYVNEATYDEFMPLFLATVKNYKVGDPSLKETFLGRLARPAHRTFLQNQIGDAVERGGEVAFVGKDLGEGSFPPTVVEKATHDMLLMNEESFGPVIGVMKVSSDDEALKLMQDTTYGLTAGIFCRNIARASSMLEQIKSGSAYINCCDRVSSHLPWSGRNNSGLGATSGPEGIFAFVQPKAWHVRA